jgi:hypothetical protein
MEEIKTIIDTILEQKANFILKYGVYKFNKTILEMKLLLIDQFNILRNKNYISKDIINYMTLMKVNFEMLNYDNLHEELKKEFKICMVIAGLELEKERKKTLTLQNEK